MNCCPEPRFWWLLPLLILVGCSTPPRQAEPVKPQIERPAKPVEAKPVDPKARMQAWDEALQSLRAGDQETALKRFEQFRAQYGDSPALQANVGLVFYNRAQYDKAKEALLAAVGYPAAPAAWHNQLGMIYRQLGEFRNAEQAYLKALALQPDYARAHRNLAILYDLYLQELPKAVAHYRRALAVAPDPEIESWIGDLERRIAADAARSNR